MTGQILTPDRRVRVFLSSRIPEFRTERKALARLIEQMGLTPIFFEEVPRPHPPRELYTSLLEQSDLFVGIYGTGYGWVDEDAGMVISGVHHEWQLSDGMPRLIFVKETTEPREQRLEELLTEIGKSGVTFNHFSSTRTLIKRARSAIALCLTERFLAQEVETTTAPPNYIEQVGEDLKGHPLIATAFVERELRSGLATHSRIFIQGSPGAGKTVALYQLAQSNPSAIYLSLRNESLLGAASNIAARLAQAASRTIARFTSAAEAIATCESLLRRVRSLVLIDDVDQMPDVAARLSSIAPGASTLVFAGRFVPPAFEDGFRVFSCGGFVESEAKDFLASTLGGSTIRTQTALERSHGNPLYLRYYVEQPANDPPASLTAFHARMWNDLTPAQRELVGTLALSEVALNFEQIAEVLRAYRGASVTGIAAQTEVQQLGHLASVHAGRTRLFHPAFRDFVCAELSNSGLARNIHAHLADAFQKPSELFLHVVHSVRGGMSEKVYRHLLRTASWATITGRIALARDLLAATLRIARRKHHWLNAGWALHQAADLKQTTRSVPSALLSAHLAEWILSRSRSKEAALAARITKGVFLIELGRSSEADAILTAAVEECKKRGLVQIEAVTRINLSYLRLRQGRLRECAVECEKAKPVFDELGDLWGVTTAVLNAQNYYVAEYDRPKLIESIKTLLKLAKKLDSPRVEMAAYNGMTVLYRREKKYALAEKSCLKAIGLARTLGFWTVEAINTGNLGNVYRDQNRFDDARECYQKALQIGEERGSKHHVAWAKEQLATISACEGKLEESLKIGEEALTLWREIGDAYREANTEDDQAGTYAKLQRHFEAAKSYERAAAAWVRSDMCGAAVRATRHACEAYVEGGHYEDAARCFEEAWIVVLSRGTAKDALQMLRILSPAEPHVVRLIDLAKVIEAAAPLFGSVENRLLVMDAVAALSGACKQLSPEVGDRLYAKHLQLLAEQILMQGSVHSAMALVFSVEQAAASVIDSHAFKETCIALGVDAPDLRYRNDESVGERWTVVFPAAAAPAIELIVGAKSAGLRAAAAIIMLIIWAKRDTIVKQMGRRRWRRLGFIFAALSVGEAKAHGIEIPDDVSREFPGILAQLTDPADPDRMPLPFFIEDEFLTYADRTKDSRNNCSLWLTMLFYDAIVQNFTHFTIPRRKATKLRRDFIEDVFGLRYGSEAEVEDETDIGDDLFEGQQ